jgi:NADH-quinone oxidoreductase subunit N
MTSETLLASLHLSIPELILAIGALVLLMIGVFSGERSGRMVSVLAIIVLAVAALWLVFVPSEGLAYGGVFLSDGFGRFMKVTALVGSIVRCSCRLALPRRTSSTSSSSRFCSCSARSASC